jgi:hypothetical protein
MCCHNRCHGNAVMEFWALRYNIYDFVFTTMDFPVILDGQFNIAIVMIIRDPNPRTMREYSLNSVSNSHTV